MSPELFMKKVNRLPPGTELRRGKKEWTGIINSPEIEEPVIGPISNPNLGTVVERLIILKQKQDL